MSEVATLTQLSEKYNSDLYSAAFAQSMDQEDALKSHRSSFHFPVQHDGVTPYRYFCGNSLGLQHRDVESHVVADLKKWREQAVEGHFLQPNPWFEIDDVLREDMAKIVGGKPSEVVIMNSLTANLHTLLTAFYRPDGARRKILSEVFPFPSDTHALVSQVALHGLVPEECYLTVSASPSHKEPHIIPTEEFLKAIEQHGDEVAVLLLGAVHFLTGQFFDIAAITAAAHKKGILVGIDAAHAVGNVPLQFHDWGVDFACWCTYKYLNGGPGNIAGLFVHEKHTPTGTAEESANRPLRGWWGHERSNRFALHRHFQPSAGAAAFQLSNPCVLSIASLVPSVRLCASIGMPTLRAKSTLLTCYLELLLKKVLPHAIEVISPTDPTQRGAQLSIRIRPNTLKQKEVSTDAYACGNNLNNDSDLVQRLLLDRGVMVDNRPPDILRVAPTPTYNSFEDVFAFVDILASLF